MAIIRPLQTKPSYAGTENGGYMVINISGHADNEEILLATSWTNTQETMMSAGRVGGIRGITPVRPVMLCLRSVLIRISFTVV